MRGSAVDRGLSQTSVVEWSSSSLIIEALREESSLDGPGRGNLFIVSSVMLATRKPMNGLPGGSEGRGRPPSQDCHSLYAPEQPDDVVR
jgi:hypothetical protein